jgi:hypothetical protein
MAGKQFISAKKAARLVGRPVREVIGFCELHRGSKYVRFEDGIYRVRLGFLVRHFDLPAPAKPPIPAAPPAPEPVSPGPTLVSNTLVALLEAQLAEKDRQLAAKDSQLGQLIERNREQNNIIYALEQSKQALEARLSLPLPSLPERAPKPEPVPEGPGVNYLLIGLAVLAAGMALMILYGLLLG